MSPRFLRPSPVLRPNAPALDPHRSVEQAVERLSQGGAVLLVDHYGRGADILEALAARLGPLPAGNGEELRRERRRRRELAQGLLAPVEHGRIRLEGAAETPLIGELYPDLDRFWLPLVDLQALLRSHWRFVEGVHFPVLGHSLHPWHGVYCPDRTVHLELFGTWLKQYTGPREHAVDVGTGCGVLAFQLARSGVGRVTATDVNPNAVESLRRDLARHTPAPAIRAVHTDLMEDVYPPVDLVVFNPPWIPGAIQDPLDRALFYDDDVHERFFVQARARVRPAGRVVVLYSTVGQLLRPDLPHPVEAELERGRFTLDQRLQRRVKPKAGQRTRERVELWVLTPVPEGR